MTWSTVSRETWKMCRGYPVSLMDALCKTIFWVSQSIILSQWALSPRRPKWAYRVFSSLSNKCPLQDHLSSKAIIWACKAPSPGRPEQWIWRVFPSVIEKQLFQNHLFEYNDHINLLKPFLQETWAINVQGFLCIPVCLKPCLYSHYNSNMAATL